MNDSYDDNFEDSKNIHSQTALLQCILHWDMKIISKKIWVFYVKISEKENGKKLFDDRNFNLQKGV